MATTVQVPTNSRPLQVDIPAEKLYVSDERDLTRLLQARNRGDREALAVLTTLVQHDLREMARRILADEQGNGRWRPTELVHESYLRLLDWRAAQWQNRHTSSRQRRA